MSRDDARFSHDQEALLAELDAAIARGIDSAEAGRVKPAVDVFDRLEAKYRAMSGEGNGSADI
jgi:antitoxin ParD1/3/4